MNSRGGLLFLRGILPLGPLSVAHMVQGSIARYQTGSINTKLLLYFSALWIAVTARNQKLHDIQTN